MTRSAAPAVAPALTADTSPAAVRTDGLTKVYGGRTVVDRLSFTLPVHSITGFVGPNGAGKTTTIRMLLGLVRPTSGSGEVAGAPLTHPAAYLGRVGAMIEGPAFTPGLSGRDNLLALARAGGVSASRVPQVLERVGMAERGGDRFRSYSLGMKQRLGIAAALLPRPELLILDEPTNGLDPSGIAQMRHLIAGLRDEGITVFVSSHLLSEVEQVADHLVLIDQGRLVYQGTLEQLVRRHSPRIVIRPERSEHTAGLVRIAEACGWTAAASGDGEAFVDLPTTATSAEAATRSAELNRRAHDEGITLTRLDVLRPTLEEAFFELTGSRSGDVK